MEQEYAIASNSFQFSVELDQNDEICSGCPNNL